MDHRDLQKLIRPLVEPTVERLGFELVAVEWVGGGGGPVLRLSVDSETGVSADDCGLISEQISPLLDEKDPFPQAWHLEVSSPGIERPVQRLQDFERFVGFRIKIRAVEGAPRRRLSGMLSAVDGDEIIVNVDGVEHRLALEAVERAHLVLDLDEYQKLAEGFRT